eukprot:scaffold4845_cov98-Isochrysis_galbana.AAC.7
MEARRCRVQVRDEIGSRHGGPGGARRHRIPPDDEVLFLEYTPTMSAQIRSRHLSPRGTPRAPVAAAFGRSAGPGVIVTRACLHVARRRVTHAPTLTFPWLAVAQLGTPASRLAEVIRAAAHEIVVLVDALDASNLRDELSEPLALVEKARAECSEPAARQLASLLVLGARHKSARCKNVTPGSGCRFGVHCCFMHGEHDRCIPSGTRPSGSVLRAWAERTAAVLNACSLRPPRPCLPSTGAAIRCSIRLDC